jgi:hypothetical protein
MLLEWLIITIIKAHRQSSGTGSTNSYSRKQATQKNNIFWHYDTNTRIAITRPNVGIIWKPLNHRSATS